MEPPFRSALRRVRKRTECYKVFCPDGWVSAKLLFTGGDGQNNSLYGVTAFAGSPPQPLALHYYDAGGRAERRANVTVKGTLLIQVETLRSRPDDARLTASCPTVRHTAIMDLNHSHNIAGIVLMSIFVAILVAIVGGVAYVKCKQWCRKTEATVSRAASTSHAAVESRRTISATPEQRIAMEVERISQAQEVLEDDECRLAVEMVLISTRAEARREDEVRRQQNLTAPPVAWSQTAPSSTASSSPPSSTAPSFRSSAMLASDVSEPEHMLCPISLTMMKDPVRCVCNPSHAYERSSIELHLHRHQFCPLSKLPLRLSDLTSDRPLKQEIRRFMRRHAR